MSENEEQRVDIACQRLVELVTEYLEGTLDPPTVAAIEAHLAICPPCLEYIDQFRTTVDLLGHVPVDSLSDTTKNDLLTAFREFSPNHNH